MRLHAGEDIVRQIRELTVSSFVHVSDFPEPRETVSAIFSRSAQDGELIHIRNGLYWKGITTVLGMLPPPISEVGFVLGGIGSGPAGVAAAHTLGLTTQMPSIFQVAVPGPLPAPYRGLSFVQRPASRHEHGLTTWEVAVLEVLRGGPAVIETGPDAVAEVVARLSSEGKVRLDQIDAAVQREPHETAEKQWLDLRSLLSG